MSTKPPSTDTRIFRATEGPYFSLRRKTAQDRNLSFEARGMLAYLLSKPVDWIVKPTDLEQQCGRDRVYRILNELIHAGYIVRTEVKEKGKHIGIDYAVYEIPPYPEKPDTVSPDTEKPDIREQRGIQNRESISAPTNGAVKSSSNGQPKKKQPDALFDLIGSHLFDAPPGSPMVSIQAGRIARVKKALVTLLPTVTPQNVSDFVVWYADRYDVALPKDAAKVASHFSVWLKESVSAPVKEVKPEDLPPEYWMFQEIHGKGI